MKAALEGRPVKEFAAPPEGTIPQPTLDCPTTWDGISEIPSGCPTPDVQNEFSPEPIATDTLPTDSATPPTFASPDVTASQSPDGTLFSPTAEPTPAPTDSAGQPIQEGRP